jgi:AAA+ superfamily predicted ATPase
MSLSTDALLDDALANAGSATSYRISRGLAAGFPGKAILETTEGEFDPWEHGGGGNCDIAPAPEVHSELVAHWSGPGKGMATGPLNACLAVQWKGHALHVVQAHWSEAFQTRTARWVVADSMEVARSFFLEVIEWCHAPKREILTFNGGCWNKSKSLYEAIAAATFDDLILAGSLKDAIVRDFADFLASRAEYEKYGVPWKRGVLLVGPPGNGKTHCLRATVKSLGVACLYVQSIQSRYEPDDANILKVFKHARTLTPCCLVFEDLDAMITPQNRSFFLNQLDGFHDNPGILTIATTNHPERLDPAILSRPSRFDRKYHFEPPALPERLAYVRQWNRKFDVAMRLRPEEEEAIASSTDGFSFAYLKELFVASMVRWMADKKAGDMPRLIEEQQGVLREHLRSDAAAPPPKPEDASALESMMKRFF